LSAGILAYRHAQHGLEVLLVHPGGPFWRNKDDGAWSIPKGEIDQSEDPRAGSAPRIRRGAWPGGLHGLLQPLGEIRQRGGNRVVAFYGKGEFDTARLASNSFDPSGAPQRTLQTFPEVDRAEWFDLKTAKAKILSGQIELIDRLAEMEL
jgi:predicted NUDIX family NTP pyrophosphohydrolase